jgi:hypothetical protein
MPNFQAAPDESSHIVKIATQMLEYRTRVMKEESTSLTGFLGRVSDPFEQSDEINSYRLLQSELDQRLALLYGWGDLQLEHGFSLDLKSLSEMESDGDEEVELPDDLFALFIEFGSCSKRLGSVPSQIGGAKPPWRFGLSQELVHTFLSRLASLNLAMSKEKMRSSRPKQKSSKSMLFQPDLLC